MKTVLAENESKNPEVPLDFEVDLGGGVTLMANTDFCEFDILTLDEFYEHVKI